MNVRLLPACLTASALALAALTGCGDNSKDEQAATTPAAPAATQTPAATTTPQAPGGASKVSKDLKKKPTVPAPSGNPPAKLVVKDIVVGKGPKAKAGDTVSVQYVGIAFSTGQQFDASWDRGQPFEFPLGAGQVIQGWDKGVPGMREGGRRELIIPPDLGYGAQGAGGGIGPNETLIFVVDLEKVS